MEIDQVRNIVDKFRYGIFVNARVPSHAIAGKKASRAPYQKKLAEIVSKIESETFNDGYHIPVGFGSGSCKRLYLSRYGLCRFDTGEAPAPILVKLDPPWRRSVWMPISWPLKWVGKCTP